MVKKLRERPDKQSEQTNRKPNNKFKNKTGGSEPLFSVAQKALLAVHATLCVLTVAGMIGFIIFKDTERKKSNRMYAEKCTLYNDTTIKINRKTDGKIAKLDELESRPEIMLINKYLIDFVNETHTISTEKLPDDVKLTLVPDGCNAEWTGAYALAEASGALGDRGIYLKSPLDIGRLTTIYHEIGHLQPGGEGNEVIAGLNEFEHALMGYVLISNQPDFFIRKKFFSRSDKRGATTWWSKYFIETVMENLYPSVDLIHAGESLGTYNKADIFIFNKLVELEGDFAALRSEVIKLRKNGELSDAIDSEAVRFTDEYSGESSKVACYGKMNEELKHAYYLELVRRFEPSIAEEFLNETSFFPDPNHISIGQIFVVNF